MGTDRIGGAESRKNSPPGFGQTLTRDAVTLYKYIVANPDWSRAHITAALGFDNSRITSALGALHANRLLRPSIDPKRDWNPVGPECALVDLLAEEECRLRREQAMLVHAREELLSLQPTYFEALQRRAPNAIDVVPSAISGLLTLHAQQATAEMCIIHPGYQPGEMQWLNVFESIPPVQERDLDVRVVLDHSARQHPSAQRQLKLLNAYTKEVRITHAVPLWFVLFDRKTAMLPAWGNRPEAGVAVVRHPAVVRSLHAAFELLWDLALPFPAEPVEQDEFQDHVRQDILRHLAAGYKDEVVARRLGFSVRTCRRHIATIMEQLGATSRFQAGVLAERLLLNNEATDQSTMS